MLFDGVKPGTSLLCRGSPAPYEAGDRRRDLLTPSMHGRLSFPRSERCQVAMAGERLLHERVRGAGR